MIRLEGLIKIYQSSKKRFVKALNGIDLTLDDTGLVCIVGKSGCGKTTLLNCLGTLDTPTEGKVYLSDENGSEICLTDLKGKQLDKFRNMHLGVVFQEYNLIPEWTVEDNIRVALDIQDWKEKDKEEINRRILEVLQFVELEDVRDRYIKELSGGQQQRVAIARVIVKEPKLLLADEPTGNLDSENGRVIMELLKKYSEKCLVVVVTHDVEAAEQYADRIIFMKDGEIAEDKKNVSEEVKRGELFLKREDVHTKRMPLASILHLAENNLQVKKLKLFFSLLVLVIIVCGGKVCTTFLCNDVGKAASDYLVKNNSQFLYCHETLIYQAPFEFEDEVDIKNRKQLQEKLCQQFGEENCHAVIENLSVGTEKSEDPLNCKAVVGGVPDQDYEFTGELPKQKNEIVITDYLAFYFNMPEDCIGMSIMVNGLEMKITGIVSLGIGERENQSLFFEESYDPLYSDGTRLLVSDEFPQYLSECRYMYLPFSNLGDNFSIEEEMERIIPMYSMSDLEEDSYELISGRMPENNSEVLVSEWYATANLYLESVDEIYEDYIGFMDIHNPKQKDTFSGYLSLYDYLPDIKVVGIVSVDVADIIVSDDIFNKIKQDFARDYYADSYEVVLNDKTRNDKDIYNYLLNESITLDMEDMELLYFQNETFCQTKWIYEILLCVVGILLILLLIIFFSFNVKDNHIKIGILKAMGISNVDLMKIWLTEAGILAGITWFVSSGINLVFFGRYNSNFREHYGYLSNIIHYNLWSEGLIVLLLIALTIFTVIMPIWVMSDKKPVQLIRGKS
ncbi:MAG: ATP-binding cassette domain-containing protein [Lachnospiraceae bacterium]